MGMVRTNFPTPILEAEKRRLQHFAACENFFLINATSKDRGTQRQSSENICSEDDLRSRIFGTFFQNFLLACLS